MREKASLCLIFGQNRSQLSRVYADNFLGGCLICRGNGLWHGRSFARKFVNTRPMNATAEAAPEAPAKEATEFSKLTPLQKIAAFLLILDADNAARIMGQLEEAELEAISTEMAKFTTISQEMQKEILQEFSPVALQAATAVSGGVERVKGVLEKAVGMFRASDILGRVSPQRPSVAAMHEVVEMEPRALYNALRTEQLQTIALVVSYLSAEKASQLLNMLRPEQRDQVIERLAMLAPTSMEVVESVAESLRSKCVGSSARPLSHTGGVKVAAEILNALPKNVTDSILISLKERNAELGEAVLKKMLTFEELEKLDGKTLQKILQEVDFRSLAIALKTAPPTLKTKMLSCISKRAADNVREEIGFLDSLKVSQIETAQMEIIEIVRRMENEGTIDLEDLRRKG
jgi:flagellar motor switch protein FliG